MKGRFAIFCCVLLLLVPASTSAGTAIKSTEQDQKSVEVTVYNSNLGLIKDTRLIDIPTGSGELRFMDVAASIVPVTVHVAPQRGPGDFIVLEQNYEYDLMNADKLLDKYVGKEIKIIDWNRYHDRKDVIQAELLSNNDGQIYRIDGEIYLGHPGFKVLPELPENLIAKPTLTWLYENTKQSPCALEVSYLTGNISWEADYIMVLNEDDRKADLSGWVTIDNRSGAGYREATLKLIAGEIHRAEEVGRDRAVLAEMVAKAAPQFEEKAFFEYHIYDLQRKTTIKDRQTKQIRLFEAADVSVEKELLVYGSTGYFTRQYREKNPEQPVAVYVFFQNSLQNNLGIPLPEGTIRLYKKDAAGSQQFIGEDRIRHTPKDEKVRLKVGEAFDVVAERKQTDFQQKTSQLFESQWEVKVRNHKMEDVVVGIIEPLYGNWSILRSSHSYRKLDAFTIRFDVTVPADGEVTVTYRVRVGL
ncbi:MAG: DUF4139 domain-containing protein [Deltaproteobacteria bacterium]|nr:DUF4139 domain-containing protein [Deltaproteobacteria bacterium]